MDNDRGSTVVEISEDEKARHIIASLIIAACLHEPGPITKAVIFDAREWLKRYNGRNYPNEAKR